MDEQAIMEVIITRKSIRKYKPDPIPADVVEKLIEAARWSPSTDNAQAWRFIAVRDRNIIEQLGVVSGTGVFTRLRIQQFLTGQLQKRFKDVPPEKKAQVFKKLTSGFMSGYLGTAPLVIVVCGHKNSVAAMVYDCSAALENILIAAHGLGLGATWTQAVTSDPRDEARTKAVLNIPEDWKVISAVSIGYPGEAPGPRPRKPLEDIVYYDRWGQDKPRGGEVVNE
ncbi:MAG: nitroreductase family protein [Clostridia bacterium]|nr:MAG: nitroreductase family protein [Clostridia bacterium]